MHRYFIKTPKWVKQLFASYVWSLPGAGREVYLSFDDGPHPEITPWVLEQLEVFGAEASFFCIGDNVQRFPQVYQQILQRGHVTGNHTQHHLNGWKTGDQEYLNDIALASELISSPLFRPPYGRIRSSQARQLVEVLGREAKVIMWEVLSADFDRGFSPEQCVANVVDRVRPGSIVVFHDSEKAWPNLKVALPRVLEFLRRQRYACKKIEL